MEVEAAASETETVSASSAAPLLLLLLDSCARAPPPGSLKAAGVRDGDTLGALAAVTWCPTCSVELGGEHWSCPGCGQDAEALSRAAHCSNVALVDLVTERALAPQTASFAEGWVCSQCLFYNPWQLTHLSTLPSKDGTTRESRHTSAAANAAAAAAAAAAATANAAAAVAATTTDAATAAAAAIDTATATAVAAIVKVEEEEPPAWPEGAIVEVEEEEPPAWPEGAIDTATATFAAAIDTAAATLSQPVTAQLPSLPSLPPPPPPPPPPLPPPLETPPPETPGVVRQLTEPAGEHRAVTTVESGGSEKLTRTQVSAPSVSHTELPIERVALTPSGGVAVEAAAASSSGPCLASASSAAAAPATSSSSTAAVASSNAFSNAVARTCSCSSALTCTCSSIGGGYGGGRFGSGGGADALVHELQKRGIRTVTSASSAAASSSAAATSASAAATTSSATATPTSAAPATPPHKLYAVCRLCHNHDALAGAACTAASLGCPVETQPTPAVTKAASSAEEAPSAEKLKQTAVEEEVERAKCSRALGESQMGAGEYGAAVTAFDAALVVFNMAAGRGGVILGSDGDAEAAARKAPMLSYTISKDELLSTALPELYCSKAEALLKLGQFEDALEAATEAAGLKPTGARLHCRTHSLAAAALRRLCREDDAAAALQRFERVAQEYAAILAQRPRLLRYQNYHQNGRADHSLPPAPCQPPLGAPAAFPPRAVQSGLLPAAAGRTSRVASLLIAVFNEEDVRGELLSTMSLHSKRASCCCCSTLRSYVSANLHAPSLAVRIEDATFDNAAFVGRLPRLGTLHVQGESFLSDGIDLNKLRSLNRIATGSLSFEAALFVGAALSGGEHTLRLSSGACVALPPLRTRERVNLAHRQLRDKDLAVLLGALSLNQHLKELDLNEPRGANAIMYTSNLRAAMVAALPWPLLRCKGTMRFDLADDKPTLF